MRRRGRWSGPSRVAAWPDDRSRPARHSRPPRRRDAAGRSQPEHAPTELRRGGARPRPSRLPIGLAVHGPVLECQIGCRAAARCSRARKRLFPASIQPHRVRSGEYRRRGISDAGRPTASDHSVLFPMGMRDNRTLLWTVVLFLGGSLLFRSLRNATEDSETWVAVLVQVGALVVLIGAVVLVGRRARGGEGRRRAGLRRSGLYTVPISRRWPPGRGGGGRRTR